MPSQNTTAKSRVCRSGTPSAAVLDRPEPNADHRFIAAAEAVESFGGFFFDEDGNPTVYLKNPASAPAVDGQLRAIFLSGPIGVGPRAIANKGAIRYRAGRYDFRQLASFGAIVSRLLDHEASAQWIDIDEANNRITLAVSDIAAHARLNEAIQAAGVPLDAYVVNLEGPSVPVAGPGDSLTSAFNAIPGGVLINDNGPCTLGFTINWNGRPAFVTASHCTPWFAGLSPTLDFGQPVGGSSAMTDEVADPRPWQNTGDCVHAIFFSGVDVCRYSDAAIFLAHDSVANSRFAVGYIARLAGYLNTPSVNQSNPRWEISGKKTTAYVGEAMEKQGISTYWTQGLIANSCTTQYQPMLDGQKAKLWCQHVMSWAPLEGDSGGPVFFRQWCGLFQYLPDGGECVDLAGIVYARSAPTGLRA